MSSKIYEILLPAIFDHGFDYAAPVGMALTPGDYVKVPFGRRTLMGVVWGEGKGGVAPEKIKNIHTHIAHLPPMSDQMRAFIDWVAWYTMSPRGNVLKMTLFEDALGAPKREVRYKIAEVIRVESRESSKKETSLDSPFKLTPARLKILAYLADGAARTSAEIQKYANVSQAVIKQLADLGGLEKIEQLEASEEIIYQTPQFKFSPEQQRALTELETIFSCTNHSTLDSNHSSFKVALLDGVTGSGKTEVYFALIEKQIRAGKQVLVLLPEIGLSLQWLDRFQERFGAPPHIWHSGVTNAKKRSTWQAVADGSARVVVGARSALFLPFKNLALIIVDEEHDHSYKQEDGVMYQARDMAVVRARRENIPALLVSATPSLETTVNAESGKYHAVHLHERFAEASLPKIETIDMRLEKLPSGNFLSSQLKRRINDALSAGGQAMLFINRRGYAPLVLCKTCGHRFCCPNCSSWLVMHKKQVSGVGCQVSAKKNTEESNVVSLFPPDTRHLTPTLLCHHCGYHAAPPTACPACDAKKSFTAYGPGVERVTEEIKTLLPNARVGMMTSDLIDSPGELAQLISDMERGDIDILVGTQMISKGYHFAKLSLVGVVDADMGLSGGDLRAGERTYQLLHQLSGRAGREKLEGSVLLQSYMPSHPVMEALVKGDRDLFMRLESDMRRAAQMPPFGRLVALIVEGNDDAEVQSACRALAQNIPASGIRDLGLKKRNTHSNPPSHLPLVLGPAPAPLTRLRGRTRYRFLLKADRDFPVQEYMYKWLESCYVSPGIRIKIDVDPYSFW